MGPNAFFAGNFIHTRNLGLGILEVSLCYSVCRQDMTDIFKSNEDDGRNYRTRQWIDAHASALVANDASPLDGEDEQGFVGRLYGLCLRELQDFHRQQREISKSRSNVLKECLGRLYLWGEPFGSGDLDKALGQSDELRDNVLERLIHVGELLSRSKLLSHRIFLCSHS